MSQHGWENAPEDVRRQVAGLVEALGKILGDNLVGVYLHGSLAMGCFNPEASDIDLLAVTRRGMAVETKREIAEFLLDATGKPNPIEMSFLREEHLRPWRHPTLFDLHFSEAHLDRYRDELAGGTWKNWNESQEHDEDLAAHIIITRHRGICLVGEPIESVFPEVPSEDYVSSLVADIEWARNREDVNPVYRLLNLCRVYAYLRDGEICSKDEGGVWAIGVLREDLQVPVAVALKIYRGKCSPLQLREESVETAARYIERRIEEFRS